MTLMLLPFDARVSTLCFKALRKWPVFCLPSVLYEGHIASPAVDQQVINIALSLNTAECQEGIVFKACFNQLVVLLVG